MKFFEEQEKARRKSRQLIALFVLMLVVMEVVLNGMTYWLLSAARAEQAAKAAKAFYGVQRVDGVKTKSLPIWPFAAVTISSLAVVLGAAAFRSLELRRGGGSHVAKLAGGLEANVANPLEKRLINVIEEMSLASGTPKPRVYVMRSESGINAFAAGWNQEDAAICVTRGCLEGLTRDELQGVVAHEFSHIFNADMRVNIRAMGLLFGLYALSIAGRELMEWMRVTRDGNRNVGLALALLGLACLALGLIGQWLGKILIAAISRQREFLADASAVQFTRNAEGIGGALRKIGGAGGHAGRLEGSHVAAPQALAMSHMFLGAANYSLANGLFATHPPLAERIERIYGRPMAFMPPLKQSVADEAGALTGALGQDWSAEGTGAGVAAHSSLSPQVNRMQSTGAGNGARERELQDGSWELGAGLARFGVSTRAACSDKERVGALCVALMIVAQGDGDRVQAALSMVDASERALVAVLMEELIEMDRGLHVALLDLCSAALRSLEAKEKERVLSAMALIGRLDGRVSTREKALFQVAKRRMSPGRAIGGKAKLAQKSEQASGALAWVARLSSRDEGEARGRYEAGALGLSKRGVEALSWEAAGKGEGAPAWAELDMLAPLEKPSLAKAIGAAAEGSIEGEDVCRIACALIGCPAPYASANAVW